MRYFAEIAYNGAHYYGWQRQPQQISVQQTIEDSFSTILGTTIEIVGCGRTDTGVHASQYFFHFDFDGEFPKAFLRRINKFLPKDILIFDIFPVNKDAHARFDATSRSYVYHLELLKNPFRQQTAYYYPYPQKLNFDHLNEAAALLMNYGEFFPFCKTDSDVNTMKCTLTQSHWTREGAALSFHISANRFLRGMVRLIVGMCLNVGMGKTSIQEVEEALSNQTRLTKSWSVPPEGLFLKDIKYSFLTDRISDADHATLR